MRKTVGVMLAFAALGVSAFGESHGSPASRSKAKDFLGTSKTYWGSVGLIAGASAWDAGTSLYLNKYASPQALHEANPLLANPDGTFSPQRGIGAKVIVLANTVFVERLIVWGVKRKYGESPARRIEKAFSWVNVGFAGSYAAVAGHNMSLR